MTKIGDQLISAIKRHGTVINDIKKRSSSLLELSAMMLAVQHYELKQYRVSLNSKQKKFRPKWHTGGDPRQSSYWIVSRGNKSFEIHMNTPVWDPFTEDTSTLVVDVGIINKDANLKYQPNNSAIDDGKRRRGRRFSGFLNKDLITFIEAKYLPIYPMLIAHFIGIVHELKPWALGGKAPSGFRKASHFDPTLVSQRNFSANAERMVEGMGKRKFSIRIVQSFDRYVERGNLIKNGAKSILDHSDDRSQPIPLWAK